MSAKSWSDKIAALAVDALVDHKLVRQEDLNQAAKIVAEELNVRLSLNDYPPLQEVAPNN